MAEIDKPKTRLETSTFTRFLDLKPIEKFDGLKFPTNDEQGRQKGGGRGGGCPPPSFSRFFPLNFT